MILLDSVTLAEYMAQATASAQAQAVVNALSGTVNVKVYDGAGTLKGSGVMAAPWATQSGGVITVGEVTSFAVSSAGTPDANWYLRFEAGSRWLRGSFGLAGSGQECIWSLPTWAVGQMGQIGTGTIGVPSNAAPSLVGAPSALSFQQGSAGTYDFSQHAIDPDGDALTYALIGTPYTGISINSTTGVLTVGATAAAAVRALTIRVTDPGGLSSDWSCTVTVTAATAVVDIKWQDAFNTPSFFPSFYSSSGTTSGAFSQILPGSGHSPLYPHNLGPPSAFSGGGNGWHLTLAKPGGGGSYADGPKLDNRAASMRVQLDNDADANGAHPPYDGTYVAWASNTAYSLNARRNANGNLYRCTQAGTSGNTAPSGTGTGIVDGSCRWSYVFCEQYDPAGGATNRRRAEVRNVAYATKTTAYYNSPYLHRRPFWHVLSLFVPADWDLSATSSEMIVAQIKDRSDGMPWFCLNIKGGKWAIRVAWDDQINVNWSGDDNIGIPLWKAPLYESTAEAGLDADMPDPTVSRAALADLGRGNWTHWAFNMNVDNRTAAQGGQGFVKAYKRKQTDAGWTQILNCLPRTITYDGQTYARGIGCECSETTTYANESYARFGFYDSSGFDSTKIARPRRTLYYGRLMACGETSTLDGIWQAINA